MKYLRKSGVKQLKNSVAINLPNDYPWKVLSLLANDLSQFLTESDNCRLKNIIRYKNFDDYRQLSEDWGLQSICPDDMNLLEIKAKYQLSALIKKYQFKSDKAKRKETALQKFLYADSICADFNRNDYVFLAFTDQQTDANVFSFARSFLGNLLGPRPGKISVTEWSRHGPGSTLCTKNGRTSSYYKFSEWPYSCTKRAAKYARFLIETDQRWLRALKESYCSRKKIPLDSIDSKAFWSDVLSIVDGNRIAFVPKDAQTDRPIAIEPVLNLMLQLSVDGFMRRRLKRYHVDLDSQLKNQELARLGSISGDFVTIDLAAASDSISLRLCKELLPDEWYTYLYNLRCDFGILEDGSSICYQKISSMGNGYTFALESAIFTALIYGVMKEAGEDLMSDNFAVFGDDLIVRTEYADHLIRVLNLSGFRINTEKSFLQGPIRESCGTDWFNGRLIRPVFFKEKPESVMMLFNDINRLKRYLTLNFPLNESTPSIMEKWIPESFKDFRGPYSDEDFDSYLHTDSADLAEYKYCVYSYKRLITLPLPQKGNQFLFRTLMHNLRPRPLTPFYTLISMNRFERAGNRFTITRRNAEIVCWMYSHTDYWCVMYTLPKYSDWLSFYSG
jgi:hypothetical protein